MQHTLCYFDRFIPGQLRSESLPIRHFQRGNHLTCRGRGCWKFWEKNPSDLERRKNDRFCLCYHHKQKFCLIYTLLGCETKTLSRKNLSSPQRLNCWMKQRCLLWNQQPIRNKNKRWLVENKNGGRKGCIDLWATIKALKQQVLQLKRDI